MKTITIMILTVFLMMTIGTIKVQKLEIKELRNKNAQLFGAVQYYESEKDEEELDDE